MPKLASFVTLPIYTACLSKAEYGTYDLIDILCSLLLPIATLQIQSAVFRFLIDEKGNEKKIKAIVTTMYVFVVPVSIVVLLALYFILGYLDPLLRVLIIVYYFADILLTVTRQVARGLSKNHIYSVSSFINCFLNMGLVVLLLSVLHGGLTELILSLSISATVSFVYVFIALKTWRYIDIKQLDKTLFKKIISYSWPMVPNSISLWIMRVSDRGIISLFLGVEANAVYAVANKIPKLLQIVQNTFSMSWQESASLSVKDADADEYYTSMFQTMYRVFAGFSAILIAVLPVLFNILIRGDYDDAYIHIPILIIGMFYSNIAVYLGGIYVANMRTKSIGITTIFAAIINLTINLLFIKSIGIFAATISTTVSYCVLMVYRMINVQKFQKIRFSVSDIIITNIVLITMCLLCSQRKIQVYIVNFIIGSVFCYLINQKLIKQFIRMGITWLKSSREKP